MMVFILIMEDGTQKEFGIGNSVQLLIRVIERDDVERIVVGNVVNGKVKWEKQFEAVTVMPSSFGESREGGGAR